MQVADSGPGIPAEYREHIFSSFTQASETCTRSHGGLGLGLAICARFAKLMGASLDVSSSDGGGAKAVLSLRVPLASPASATAAAMPAALAARLPGVPSGCLARSAAVICVHNAALRRQLLSECAALGMQALDAESLSYERCATACRKSDAQEDRLGPVLLCEASAVTAALQHGWKRRGVIALCADEPVPHALRVFATSLMMPIKHSQLVVALVGAVTGQGHTKSSLQVPLGPLQAAPNVSAPCSAGFGCKPCGFCAKCQRANDESLALLVCLPRGLTSPDAVPAAPCLLYTACRTVLHVTR